MLFNDTFFKESLKMNDESVKVTIEEALKINKVYHSLKIKNFNDFTTLKTQKDETFINKMKFVEK